MDIGWIISCYIFQKDGLLAKCCYGIEVWYPSKYVTTSLKVQILGHQNISMITQITSSFKSTLNNKNHSHLIWREYCRYAKMH
jgi:hypothetical protein